MSNEKLSKEEHSPPLRNGVVMWRFSGVRKKDSLVVYGEYPFTYQEGRECYNMDTFWRHVQSGYIDPNTVVNAT